MDTNSVINMLSSNKKVFKNMFAGMCEDLINWRPAKNKWDILEIACHLVDEECDDFRHRIEITLLRPGAKWPGIDPQGWVESRNYQARDFIQTVETFISEREKSIQWLSSLEKVNWENTYIHPKMGLMSARLLLINWLAHDYFHIRQINRYNFEYLDQQTSESLTYAGTW